MKKYEFGKEYYLTTYTELHEYLDNMIKDDSEKLIKYIFTEGPLGWREINTSKQYSLDTNIYIVFDNDTVLRMNYNFYSLMFARHMWIQNLNKIEKECNSDDYKLDLDCKNTRIEGFNIEQFSEEYEINPASGTVRPESGEYFRKIEFNLSNDKKLCICAEDSIVDGYCDIWIE